MKYIGKSVQRIECGSQSKRRGCFCLGYGQARAGIHENAHGTPSACHCETCRYLQSSGSTRSVDSTDFIQMFHTMNLDTIPTINPSFVDLVNKPFADRVRYVGDRVAAVVAETEAIAAKACALIRVDYEDLPVVCDVEERCILMHRSSIQSWIVMFLVITNYTTGILTPVFAERM